MFSLPRICSVSARLGLSLSCCGIRGMMTLTQAVTPTLYGDEASPPVRFVMMTAYQLGIKFHFHKIDLFSGENKTDFYSKINPLQKVPALDIGKEVILDSHAISLFLCRGSPNKELYPEDTILKAKVDQMLFFNSGSLFPVDSIIFSEYFSGMPIDCNKVEIWNRLLDILDMQLKTNIWLSGDKMMLCDLCCGATISSLELLVPLTNRHAKVAEWMKKLKNTTCFEINSRGLKRLSGFINHIK